jgi:ribonuclease HI
MTLQQVLESYSAGPQHGIFTDGGASPNPGPGGWGFVHVDNGSIREQRHGHNPDTTNNRMELTALIEAFSYLPKDADIDVYSDSELCVKTINIWAPQWRAKGWKRSSGPIANLPLVQALFDLHLARPQVRLKWIKAHNGWRWNEYADALATAWMRQKL